MPNKIRDDIYRIDEVSFDYIFEQNVTVQLKENRGIVRCNVYRPKSTSEKHPVLVTYGPYGKDIHYSELVFRCQRISVPKTHRYQLPCCFFQGGSGGASLTALGMGNPGPRLLDSTRLRNCAWRRGRSWSVARRAEHNVSRNQSGV